MDLKSIFSAASVVDSKEMTTVIKEFEQNWLNQFWYPSNLKGDKAFNDEAFKKYLEERSIKFHLTPPGRHGRNTIDS